MFVGLLVDLPTATSKMADALDDAVPTMSDVIITWIAWGGTVFFGGLLVERIGRTVANLYMDIVNNRHRSETLRSLSGRIEGARAYIEESQNEQKDRTDKEVKLREAILLMELVVLSKDLRKLGVNSPSANRLDYNQEEWEIHLAKLEVLAKHGELGVARSLVPKPKKRWWQREE